jgi:hypothetical protein
MFGKREEKGPTIAIADLAGKPKPKPDCAHCNNGHKSSNEITGNPSVCPLCGRLLMSEI